MADEPYDPGGDNSVVVGHGAGNATSPLPPGTPFDPGGSRYPDMTPGPPKVLSTSYDSLPSDMRTGRSFGDRILDPVRRVGAEMSEAYQNTPPLLTAEARDALRNSGWLGRGAAFAGDVASTAAADFSALGAGGLAAISEIGSGGNPQLARDIHAGLSIAPVLATGAPMRGPIVAPERKLPPLGPPPPPPPSWRPVAPGEDYSAGREYRMNQATGQREVNAGGPAAPPDNVTIPRPPSPPPTVPPVEQKRIGTPEGAMEFYRPQIEAAETSDFRLAPKFTNDWLASLEDHTTASPAGKAVNPDAPPVAKLIADLKNTANAPLDNVKSIQEVDQRIQRAISEQSGSGGDSNQVRLMRQIQQDFRDRYGNVQPDQYTGSPQGVAAFQDSLKSYAAVSRLRDVQGLIDGTEGNPNRSTLLASRVNSFLNDDRNTKGWNPNEIASLRQAANSGFVQEWMRAQGSRLVGIGSAVLGGGTGMAAGVPLQVATSYLLRNAMEDMRLKKVRDAMYTLGERVPQPGTVPPAPAPRVPSQGAVTAARYAPLVGLLGQTADQPRDQ